MRTFERPASLVPGWRGAWAYNVKPALVAIRDRGPLTLEQVAAVLYERALHADLTSGHDLGPLAGARALATAVLEDAAAIVAVDDAGRYSLAADVREFVSPWTGETMALWSADESDALSLADRAEKPVRAWQSRNVYSPFGGKWIDGRLPQRNYTPEDVDEMAETIRVLGWSAGTRIIKDQNGVTIEGHLRADALKRLAIDPDTGATPTGEPYVEIRSFPNDASRLLCALSANWATLKAPTREAVAKQVLGLDKAADLTLAVVAALIVPVATRGVAPVSIADIADVSLPPARPTVVIDPDAMPEEWKDILAAVEAARYDGITYKEYDAANHGSVSKILSAMHDAGLIVAVGGVRRKDCNPYVTPKWLDGRPEAPRKRSRPPKAAAAPPMPEPYSNEALAEMPFDQAFPGLSFNNRKARVTILSGVDHAAPVHDHVAGMLADLNAKCPGLHDLMCEYRAATRRS